MCSAFVFCQPSMKRLLLAMAQTWSRHACQAWLSCDKVIQLHGFEPLELGLHSKLLEDPAPEQAHFKYQSTSIMTLPSQGFYLVAEWLHFTSFGITLSTTRCPTSSGTCNGFGFGIRQLENGEGIANEGGVREPKPLFVHCPSRAASVPCTRVVFVGIQLGGSGQTNIWKLQCDKWPVALVAVSWFKMCSNQPVSHNRRNLRQSIHRQLLFLIYASTQLLVRPFLVFF